MNKVLVISQSINQPRVVNRINELCKVYQEVKVFSFKRKVYNNNNNNNINSKAEINIIHTFDDGNYTSRLLGYLKLFCLLVLYCFRRYDVYCFGIDCRFFASILINKKITYEISDITWLYRKGLSKKLLEKVDYLLTSFSDKVVFTSGGFYKYYYNYLNKEKVIIVENKLCGFSKLKRVRELRSDLISIGYIGSFRYVDIIKNLIDILGGDHRFEVNFHGDGNSTILNMLNKAEKAFSNVIYHGPFENPKDLQCIYNNINLNFVVYDSSLENERVAMPNKFYESAFFGIPILCSTNTYLEERVIEDGIGFSVDIDRDSLAKLFDSLSIDALEEVRGNIMVIDENKYLKNEK